jgi:very-long-chain (3R)-3-hydroxyacyl-CoA dehydratase
MTLSSTYLTAYNGLSCALWAYLTIYTLTSAPALYASGNLHHLRHELLTGGSWSGGLGLLPITQTLALVEILHAAAGLVRASPVTTAIQVVGKNLVVWTVMVAFPELVVGRDRRGAVGVWPFLGCVIFWGVSEVLRYGYFVVLLITGDTPSWLKWLRYVHRLVFAGDWEGKLMCCNRYSAFIVLYPPGLISEAWLVYLALTQTAAVSLPYRIYLLLGFLTYIPGKSSVVLRASCRADSEYSKLHHVFAYAVAEKAYFENGGSEVARYYLFISLSEPSTETNALFNPVAWLYLPNRRFSHHLNGG